MAEQINLSPLQFYSEPSRFDGFFCDNVIAATLFKLRFSAERWPTKNDDLFLMYVERSAEVSDWIASCSHDYENVNIVAIQFASDEDQENFEKVIWPDR